LKLDAVAVLERQTAKAVPFGFVLPAVAVGNGIDGDGFHWRQPTFVVKNHGPGIARFSERDAVLASRRL
jgi:hypothetical protein